MADSPTLVEPHTPHTSPPSAGPTKPLYNSTPISRKLTGDPNPKRCLQHVRMDPALKEELHESQLLDVPGLVEHLFPDKLLPVPFDQLKKHISNPRSPFYEWDRSLQNWKTFEDPATDEDEPVRIGKSTRDNGEKAVAYLFNKITSALLGICEAYHRSIPLPPARRWTSESTKPLSGGPKAHRKPDVNLVEQGQVATWSTTLVTVEVKTQSTTSEQTKARVALTNSAYMVFSTQDERRFHIGVSVCGTKTRVFVFDRAGVVGSQMFDILENWELLLRLLAGLTLGNLYDIGLDSSIRRGPGGKRFVTIANKEYEIIKTLFISDSIRGRGTVCWQGRHDGMDFVIKNTWTDTSRRLTEADILRAAGDIEGIAHIVDEETVQCRGREDSTAHIRAIIDEVEDYKHQAWYEDLEVRIHRRLVTTPLAEGLSHFKSKKELLLVLIDAIEAHRRLVGKHIIHRDISLANIMIHRPRLLRAVQAEVSSNLTVSTAAIESPPTVACEAVETDEPSVKGLLIDLDYALITHDAEGNKTERDCTTAGHRTGTLPFMALELLAGLPDGEEQRPHHDLESFFFVLLWICCHYVGPCDAERHNFDILKTTMGAWISGDDYVTNAEHKSMAMQSSDSLFDTCVMRHFTKYFKDLKPCIGKLRRVLFPSIKRDAQHQEVIDILRETAKDLPEQDNWSRKNDAEGYGPLKRKLEKIEEDSEEESGDESGMYPSPSKKAKSAPELSLLRRSSRLVAARSKRRPSQA